MVSLDGGRFRKQTMEERNMRFLEYLFYKYYNFQLRVGNENNAPMMSILFISFVLSFYYLSIDSYYRYFISRTSYGHLYGEYTIIIVFGLSFLLFYFLFLHKKKYKKIMKAHEAEWKGKKNFGAILFAVLPFIIFFVETYIKLKMNQGAI